MEFFSTKTYRLSVFHHIRLKTFITPNDEGFGIDSNHRFIRFILFVANFEKLFLNFN